MAEGFSLLQSEPVSSLATGRALAIFSVVAVVVSILIVRFGFLEMKPAWRLLRRARLRRAVDLVGLAAFAAIWQNGSRGMGRICLAFLIVPCCSLPATSLCNTAAAEIYDITTDDDPPRFEALARLRSGEGPTPRLCGLYSAEQQRIAYPDIETWSSKFRRSGL